MSFGSLLPYVRRVHPLFDSVLAVSDLCSVLVSQPYRLLSQLLIEVFFVLENRTLDGLS